MIFMAFAVLSRMDFIGEGLMNHADRGLHPTEDPVEGCMGV